MRRREFLGVLGAAAAWPAHAQQIRRVGIVLTAAESDAATQSFIATFQRRIQDLGWSEDRNIRFDKRYAAGNRNRLRENIAEILRLSPDVVLAQNTPTVADLQHQTKTVPIVFVMVSDPVGDGFVDNLAKPGRNATGFTNTIASLGGKWIELLKEAVPAISQVGYLFNRAAAPGAGNYYLQSLLSAAQALGVKAVQLELTNPDDIDRAISEFAAAGGNGLVGNSDSFILVNRQRIIAAANKHRLPSIFVSALYTNAGGMMSYGADTPQQWHGAAGYVDRILRGEAPRNLAVQLPTKMILTINIKAANALGVPTPWFLQQRADEIIE